tara:strand:+ start:106404 stop:106934 length:531 start_codon:yes stop_codon:yes gene_type:complete
MSSKRKKKYLLFLVGEFDQISLVLDEVIEILSLTMEGTHLKYIHHDNLIIAHFRSTEKLDDVNEFLDDSFSDQILSYILIPTPRNFGTRLNDELFSHLFRLNDRRSISMENYRSKKVNKISDILKERLQDMFTLEEPTIPPTQTYDLDEVLDKISKSGLKSLTSAEWEYLNNISTK